MSFGKTFDDFFLSEKGAGTPSTLFGVSSSVAAGLHDSFPPRGGAQELHLAAETRAQSQLGESKRPERSVSAGIYLFIYLFS